MNPISSEHKQVKTYQHFLVFLYFRMNDSSEIHISKQIISINEYFHNYNSVWKSTFDTHAALRCILYIFKKNKHISAWIDFYSVWFLTDRCYMFSSYLMWFFFSIFHLLLWFVCDFLQVLVFKSSICSIVSI